MNVTLLLGSIRIGRKSDRIAYYLEEQLKQHRMNAEVVDLMDTSLPLMQERVGYHPQLPHEVQSVSQRLHRTDALIFISPEYHGSFSGVLKNAVDYFWNEFSKKPIGVVTVSAGKFGGINASSQLQNLVLSLGAFPMPTKLLVPEVGNIFDEIGQSYNETFVRNTERFIKEFKWFANAIIGKKIEDSKNSLASLNTGI
ncbi:MAG: NADPH-dependent FMN reductase [Ginsengibacter sp.]